MPKVERHIASQDTADYGGANVAGTVHLLSGCALLRRKYLVCAQNIGAAAPSVPPQQSAPLLKIPTAKAHSAPKQHMQTQSLHLMTIAPCRKMIGTNPVTTTQTPARRIYRMRIFPRENIRNVEKFGGKKLFWFVFLSTQGFQKCLHFWEEKEQGSEDEFFRLRENERSELCSDGNSPQAKLEKTINKGKLSLSENPTKN